MTAMTRGPLPARVYWRRRLLLALVLLGLVVGTLRLVGLGSDPAPEAGSRATQVAAEPAAEEDEEPSVAAPDTPTETREQGASGGNQASPDREPVLVEPDGVCSDRDVAVTPSVKDAVGGAPITFVLELRTISTPACTWQASPTTLTMKITSGDDDIWSSQDCPRAIPSEELTLRNDASSRVRVTWSAKRSDDECSGRTEWAMPGWYYVDASALAGEPSNLHFELEGPEPGVEKRYVERTPKKKQQQDSEQRDRQQGEQRDGQQDRQDRKRDGQQDGRRDQRQDRDG